jgi:hypothetical protein
MAYDGDTLRGMQAMSLNIMARGRLWFASAVLSSAPHALRSD